MANEVEVYVPTQISNQLVVNVYGIINNGYGLKRTLVTPLITSRKYFRSAITLDSSNSLYVCTLSQPSNRGGEVAVYSAGAGGNVKPRQTLGGNISGINGPLSLAVDRAGQLYVLNCLDPALKGDVGTGLITAYNVNQASGELNARPHFSLSVGQTADPPTDRIAVDNNNYLYHSIYASEVPGVINIYAPSSLTPTTSIQVPGPVNMAFDSDNNLYVVSEDSTNQSGHSILVFAFKGYGAAPLLVGTIPGGPGILWGVAVDASGLVYVGGVGQGGVAVYSKGKNWDFQPVATINDVNDGYDVAVSKAPIVAVDPCLTILQRLDAELHSLGAIPAAQAASWKSALLNCRNLGKITEAEYEAAIQAIDSPTRKKLYAAGKQRR
ncbi:MAG: hypothetical protein WBW33_23285 [Bryobacteraceae bacterium]